MTSPHELDAWERSVLTRLLAYEFPGCDGLASQLAGLTVARRWVPSGSLDLQVARGADPAKVRRRVPVEGEAIDADGIPIHFLVHVADGLLRRLEIFKEDLSAPSYRPPPEAIRVTSLD